MPQLVKAGGLFSQVAGIDVPPSRHSNDAMISFLPAGATVTYSCHTETSESERGFCLPIENTSMRERLWPLLSVYHGELRRHGRMSDTVLRNGLSVVSKADFPA